MCSGPRSTTGVRPNSPPQTINVSSKSPRFLRSLIKAAIAHQGFALIDVISPCVTFNDHEASTKSYLHTREKREEVVHVDFVPHAEAIEQAADYR